MAFKDALHVLSTNLVQKMALPDWAKYLTKQTRKVDLAFKELKVCYSDSSNRACVIHNSCLEQQYMMEMVEARRDGDKVGQRYDLFSGLLDAARDEQDSEAAISDEELVGKYSTVGIIWGSWKLSYPSSQEICLSFFLLDMKCDIYLLRVVLPQTVPRRLRRIRCAFHLPCWHCILTSKSVCISTLKALCPT
jgi:hypothetical protein